MEYVGRVGGKEAVQWRHGLLILFLVAAIALAPGITFTIDDMNYLKAAQAWVEAPPYLSRTHWGLRQTLVLPLAAALGLFGQGGGFAVVMPALYTLCFFGGAWWFLRRELGDGIATGWALLFLAAPVTRTWAGLNYPDFIELMWATASLSLLALGARSQSGRGTLLLLLSGTAAALAILTRETAVWLVLLYAGLLAGGKPVARKDMLLVAAGALPVLLADTLYFWSQSGDWFYRYHVAVNHVSIPSDDMVGRVYEGRTFFNPELASRWIPDGDVNIHWALNPIIYAFIDMRYGLIWWLLVLMLAAEWRSGPASALPERTRRWLKGLGAMAFLSFATSTYALMISQRPRYYLMALACAALIVMILLHRHWQTRWLRRIAGVLLAAQAVIALLTLDQTRTRLPILLPERAAEMIAAGGVAVRVDEEMAQKLYWIMAPADYQKLVEAGAPRVGDSYLAVEDLRKGRPPFEDGWARRVGCWAPVQTGSILKEGVAGLARRAAGLFGFSIASLQKPQIVIHIRRRLDGPGCGGGE